METSPLNIPDFYISIGTKITYYPGKWQFNHLGFATFNCRPRMTYVYTESGDQTEEVNGVPSVVKYYYDYDPVIPANYYQAYSQLEYTFDAGIYNVLS